MRVPKFVTGLDPCLGRGWLKKDEVGKSEVLRAVYTYKIKGKRFMRQFVVGYVYVLGS